MTERLIFWAYDAEELSYLKWEYFDTVDVGRYQKSR